MNTVECLTKIREILAKPKNWTQLASARQKGGSVVQPDDKKAVCWCVSGAAYKVTGGQLPTYADTLTALSDSASKISAADRTVVMFNDSFGRTHQEILDWIDQTIARVQQETPA